MFAARMWQTCALQTCTEPFRPGRKRAPQARTELAQARAGVCAGKRPLLSLGEDQDGGGGEDEDGEGEGEGDDGRGQHKPSGHGREREGEREKRHYRGQRMETPSHPGGVSDRAREAQADRERRLREREREGVYADTRKR
jgi:pre-mRNA-splicing factor ATP-dependent RNA helicase DHX38/PRP16